MTKRTSPTEAIKRLSWVLNYADEGPRSLNEISKKTNLSWATTRKYIQTIEDIQKIAPKISLEDDGVYVGKRSKAISELFEDPAIALMVYLLNQAEINGSPAETIEIEACKSLSTDVGSLITQLEALGWIELRDGAIKLTPKGIQVAGPARSDVNNSGQELAGEQLTIQKRGSKSIVALKHETSSSQNQSKNIERRTPESYDSWETDEYLQEKVSEIENFTTANSWKATS